MGCIWKYATRTSGTLTVISSDAVPSLRGTAITGISVPTQEDEGHLRMCRRFHFLTAFTFARALVAASRTAMEMSFCVSTIAGIILASISLSVIGPVKPISCNKAIFTSACCSAFKAFRRSPR